MGDHIIRYFPQGWSVEIALPLAGLMERQAAAGCGAGAGQPPGAGALWRLGFSRVNWHGALRAAGCVGCGLCGLRAAGCVGCRLWGAGGGL